MIEIISTEKLPKMARDSLMDWHLRDEQPTDDEFAEAEVLMTWPNRVKVS